MSKKVIFKGKVPAEISHVGTMWQPKKRKDRFGVIPAGSVRSANINTPYGLLYLPPYKYGNKKIIVTIEEQT